MTILLTCFFSRSFFFLIVKKKRTGRKKEKLEPKLALGTVTSHQAQSGFQRIMKKIKL
jgi:hypothetical protein